MMSLALPSKKVWQQPWCKGSPMKLSEGDKIEVAENTLVDTEAGIYWVAYVSYCHGSPYYGLRKLYGREITRRFFTNTIDALIAQGVLAVVA
jgi:hypothetical protein